MKKITLLGLLFMTCFTMLLHATDYTNGYFVSNEDWFGHAPGSINYVDDSGIIHYNVFQAENPGRSLGNTTCFSTIFNDKMYIISKQGFDGSDENDTDMQGSRLVVINAITLKEIASIDNIGGDGRAFVGFNEYKGYVSTTGGVKPINLITNILGKSIPNIGNSENMYISHNRLFIQTRNNVNVVDAQQDTLISTINIPNLACLQQTEDGTIWVGTKDNKLVKIDPSTLSTTIIDAPCNFISSSFAWNPGLMATGTNAIYFATGSSWSPKLMKKYDIATNTFSDFYTCDDGLIFYGGGFRVNPINQHLIMLVIKSGFGANSEENWYIELDENGNEVSTKKLTNDYWFPTMPFFPETQLNTNSIATFEDFKLSHDSFWWGDFTATSSTNTNFTSGDFTFTNVMSYWAPNAYASNFGVSSEQSTLNIPLKGSNSAVGNGFNDSKTYGIFYAPYDVKSQMTLSTPSTVSGLYVTNNANVMNAINNGDGMSVEEDGSIGKPFGEGDYLKLIAQGYHNGTQTNTVEFYLADFRSSQSDERYALNTWEWMDLKALGIVDTVTFSFESSKNSAYGITTPNYFCLDNVGDIRPEVIGNGQTFTNNLDLDLTTITTSNNTVFDGHFSVIEFEGQQIANVSIDDNHLLVTALQTGSTSVVIMATQKSGKRIYIRIPLNITFISTIDNPTIQTNVSVNNETININTTLTDYSITVFNMNGMTVYQQENAYEATSVSCNTWTSGIYIVTVSNSNKHEIFKIIIN